MVKCGFEKALFTCIKADRGVWSQCDFSGADWSEAFLLRCTFHQSKMPKRWRASHLNQVSMQGLDLEESEWQGANLKSVNLSGTNLRDSNLSSIVAAHVHFIRANLSGVNFTQAKIENSVLIESDLQNTTFFKASLVGSWFGNAQTNEETSWDLAQKNTSCFYPQKTAAELTC